MKKKKTSESIGSVVWDQDIQAQIQRGVQSFLVIVSGSLWSDILYGSQISSESMLHPWCVNFLKIHLGSLFLPITSIISWSNLYCILVYLMYRRTLYILKTGSPLKVDFLVLVSEDQVGNPSPFCGHLTRKTHICDLLFQTEEDPNILSLTQFLNLSVVFCFTLPLLVPSFVKLELIIVWTSQWGALKWGDLCKSLTIVTGIQDNLMWRLLLQLFFLLFSVKVLWDLWRVEVSTLNELIFLPFLLFHSLSHSPSLFFKFRSRVRIFKVVFKTDLINKIVIGYSQKGL